MITVFSIPLIRDDLPVLVNNLTLNAINKFARKIIGKGALRLGKVFTLFILIEDMNNIIEIINSLDYSSVLLDRVTKTVKHEKKKCRPHWCNQWFLQ